MNQNYFYISPHAQKQFGKGSPPLLALSSFWFGFVSSGRERMFAAKSLIVAELNRRNFQSQKPALRGNRPPDVSIDWNAK